MILYDDKMKVLFHLKGGQQGELLLNLIFPDYPDGHGDDGENAQKMPAAEQSQIANATQLNEKETDKAVSFSDINAECAYTSRLGLVNKNAAANRAEGLQIAFFQMRGRGSLLKRK